MVRNLRLYATGSTIDGDKFKTQILARQVRKELKDRKCHRQQNIPILNVFKVTQVSKIKIATKTKNSQGRNAAVDKKHIGLNEQVFFKEKRSQLYL